MQLYNTLTRQKDTVTPINTPEVSIYTCGPTVYDYPHVGNWFTFVRYDTLVRTLLAANLKPKWIMNITDVGHLVSDADEGEDKLEKGAKREGKSAWDVADFYGKYFVEGLHRLNITQPSELPKATDHIPEQIELIQILENKGFTYVIDDGVYYDTSKFAHYSDFAQLDIDEQQAGARVEFNSQKLNSSDFALWKLSPKDSKRDMEWDSPWGKGFPGWHLECSAMAKKYLGDTIDIHSGGIDHIPVHHTNEIAQSEAATGKPLAHVWMHTNHITVNGEKIAKSSGNGITLEDVEQKGYDLMALRLHILESHYRSQSKFSWESLGAAQNRLKNFRALAVLRYQLAPSSEIFESVKHEDLKSSIAKIETAMHDDLSTPLALAEISSMTEKALLQNIDTTAADEFVAYLQQLDSLFGLDLCKQPDISPEQKELLAKRQTARDNQDWSASDTIREELRVQGIEVRDTPSYGQIWARTK